MGTITVIQTVIVWTAIMIAVAYAVFVCTPGVKKGILRTTHCFWVARAESRVAFIVLIKWRVWTAFFHWIARWAKLIRQISFIWAASSA